MTKAGWIIWEDGKDRHWSGLTAKRRWVHEGPKLHPWYSTFKYRGQEYRLHYVDGCFHPFVFRVGVRVPSFV
jgi:hypothetical protein